MTISANDRSGLKLNVHPRIVVEGLAPYVPGRSASEVQQAYNLDAVVKLASNENPFGPSPLAVAAAMTALASSSSYPDGAAVALRDRLGALYGYDRGNIIVGNGSDEVILLLALAYIEPGDEAVLAAPPYAIHRRSVQTAGGTPIAVPLRDHVHDLDAMAAAITDKTRLVFIANPHNPTGTTVSRSALRAFVERIPDTALLIVDEAYYDYVDDDLRFTAVDLLAEFPNVVTLRTFSKAHGLAGLRAGYGVAHPSVVSTLDRIRPPFGLNGAAQAAALAALDDIGHVAHTVEATRRGRARLEEIAGVHGLGVVPSQANFALLRVGDSVAVSEALLQRGLIVRPGENLGMPGWIRVSIGTDDEIERFGTALAAVLVERVAAPAAPSV